MILHEDYGAPYESYMGFHVCMYCGSVCPPPNPPDQALGAIVAGRSCTQR